MDYVLFTFLGIALACAAVWSRTRFADFLAQSPGDYDGQKGESFDPRIHLNGKMTCEGVIYGPLGRVSSRFVGEFDCGWEGNKGMMDEVFTYDDGSVQHRAWHLTLGNGGNLKATAADVEGDGVGVQCGNALQLKYRFRLPESAGGHVLDVVDWLYLAPNGTIVNRSQFRKFGLKTAELVATMRRVPETMKDAA